MKNIVFIAANTFREIIRDRVLYGLLAFGVLFILMSLLLGSLSFAEQARIVTNLGLAAAQVTAVILSIFVGSTLVSREIEKQTILTLLSRPISRTTFIVGKFLGLVGIVALSITGTTLLLAVLLKFYGQASWNTYWIASAGILMESIVLIAFAVFFGSFARPVLTVVFTLSIWLIGHGVEDIAFFSSKSEIPLLKNGGYVLARVLPHLEVFNWRNQVVYGDMVAAQTFCKAILLCATWSAVLLIAGSFIFKRRDFV